MLKSALRAYALQSLSFYIGVSILALFALVISIVLHSRGEIQKELIINNKNTAKEQSEALSALIVKYKMNIDDWNNGIKEIYTSRVGLNLDFAKKRIEALRIANNIKNLSISLTNPIVRDDVGPLKFTNLIHARMDISLQASSDKDILRFINSVAVDLPGVLRVVNMQMTSGLGKDGGQVINATIEMQWQNLEDIT